MSWFDGFIQGEDDFIQGKALGWGAGSPSQRLGLMEHQTSSLAARCPVQVQQALHDLLSSDGKHAPAQLWRNAPARADLPAAPHAWAPAAPCCAWHPSRTLKCLPAPTHPPAAPRA